MRVVLIVALHNERSSILTVADTERKLRRRSLVRVHLFWRVSSGSGFHGAVSGHVVTARHAVHRSTRLHRVRVQGVIVAGAGSLSHVFMESSGLAASSEGIAWRLTLAARHGVTQHTRQ